ncbi:unnamed protein product [Pieris macdunnoughi]|uniref:RdRp catalytic domain-containing protein n=1 Tax=Pieris macdunnoughi TaxID=345717 RepID=A0A821XN73_9NEOP|nr:unnamed protein product [Pieris macdunnoughi]
MEIYRDTVPFTISPFGCMASLRTLQSYGTEINNTMDNNTFTGGSSCVYFIKKTKKPKRRWMKDWLKQRNTFTHTNLLSELSLKPTDWRNFLRMDEQTYFKLLGLVTPIIKKQDTNMRQAITAHERLCATLRFLPASYIKHKERGKKDRRAIASATMLLRPFLHVIEAFHLELARDLPGSTISIGGEEKKAKITSNMEITSLDTDLATHVSQGTEDATKWNECLSPAIFYLMHHYFFDPSIRRKMLHLVHSKYGALFCQISKYGHMFQSWKMIQIGPGPIVKNNTHYTRLSWIDEHMASMNERTKEWYEKLKDYITDDRRYLRSSPGMLMGMLNAASTTIGLLPMNLNMPIEDVLTNTRSSSRATQSG